MSRTDVKRHTHLLLQSINDLFEMLREDSTLGDGARRIQDFVLIRQLGIDSALSVDSVCTSSIDLRLVMSKIRFEFCDNPGQHCLGRNVMAIVFAESGGRFRSSMFDVVISCCSLLMANVGDISLSLVKGRKEIFLVFRPNGRERT